MDPSKRRNWAEDESDEWEEEESPPPPPKVVPVEPMSRAVPKPEVSLQGEPPFNIEVNNLPFALNSETKVLPFLVRGLPAHDLVFTPFREMPRGCARVTTRKVEVAKHILGLNGTEETGRQLHIKQVFGNRRPPEQGQKQRKPQDRGERRDDRRGPPVKAPSRPAYPAVIENKNSEYSRKEPPQTAQTSFRAKTEEIKSEPVTPVTNSAALPPKPKVDPFGGAKPIDTRVKDLQFEERLKKEPASPGKKWTEPKSAGMRPTKVGSGDIKATENTPSDVPQVAETKVEPSESQPQQKPAEPPVPAIPEVKPCVQTDLPARQEVKPEPEVKVSQAPPQEPPMAEPDWDFSDPGTEGQGYQREYTRYQRRGKVLST